MAAPLSWLSTCKASQLKLIANATGINSSGTKSILTARLHHELQRNRLVLPENGTVKEQSSQNIISIDMGIRNLAYCRFTLPNNSISARKPVVPTIQEWTRIAIASKNAPDPATDSASKEAFDPATYAAHAHELITSLLPSAPTHILIERQRFRSMGGKAVQEWTLRVNMFEAMIYAVLQTYVARGLWAGAVHPVAPGKVVKFWLGNGPDSDDRTGGASKSARTKTAKVKLVASWLQQGAPVRLKGTAVSMGLSFLERRGGGKQKDRKEAATATQIGAGTARAETGKLDDLADCMLQGMAWIRWEENRRAILSHGIAAMETLKS
ncbi:hypothetical protein MMC07_004939 [Pseudocyphellaria aurata]|nr:hypothetical protein [Pseudocyphellaria aurata]